MADLDFSKVKIAGPIKFNGPAVERDATIRDENDSAAFEENDWIAAAKELDPEMSKLESEFFAHYFKR